MVSMWLTGRASILSRWIVTREAQPLFGPVFDWRAVDDDGYEVAGRYRVAVRVAEAKLRRIEAEKAPLRLAEILQKEQ